MASTLIKVLCWSLFPGDGVPSLLANLISNSENYSNIMVATLAIPKFEKYSVLCYGYKTFGLPSKISWCLEQPPPEFFFRGEICAVHTNEDPATQQFQKNWSSRWCLDFTKFFILLFVDHSTMSSHSLSKSTIDHSPSDLFRNSPNNSNTPLPLDDFPQQLHGFTCAKSSSWSQLSNPSFNSIFPLYIAKSSSIQPTQSLISPHPQSQLLDSPFDLSASFSEAAYNGPTAEPQIHMLNSPPKNSFVISPQLQPSDYSTEAYNWDSFANSDSYSYDNISVGAPVQ